MTAIDDCSAGNWVTGTPENSGSSQSGDGASHCASSDAGITELSIDEDFFTQVDVMSESRGCTSTDDGADTTLSNSDDDHRSKSNPSMSWPISFVNIAAGSTIAPPSLCLNGECRDTYCEHCAGNGLASDEDESCYQNSEDSSVNEHENDEEHFDPFEITGMLYEPREPLILLACKEIREQCLPQYHASNAFSWRFDWLNYKDSLSYFSGWVDHVVNEHTKLMTSSFMTEKGLKELGKLFVCAMHRDSGSADYPVEPG
ncbi:hypothetical protein KC318_g14476 [Hortaea werneckii]|nr:hypothetical protein KC334_g14628 [Hortaea werneckii]KAI7653087.1 hypothetical protein KC318_g14476 [Hortaea werneckii]